MFIVHFVLSFGSNELGNKVKKNLNKWLSIDKLGTKLANALKKIVDYLQFSRKKKSKHIHPNKMKRRRTANAVSKRNKRHKLTNRWCTESREKFPQRKMPKNFISLWIFELCFVIVRCFDRMLVHVCVYKSVGYVILTTTPTIITTRKAAEQWRWTNEWTNK